jgi:hypothetical protein
MGGFPTIAGAGSARKASIAHVGGCSSPDRRAAGVAAPGDGRPARTNEAATVTDADLARCSGVAGCGRAAEPDDDHHQAAPRDHTEEDS